MTEDQKYAMWTAVKAEILQDSDDTEIDPETAQVS